MSCSQGRDARASGIRHSVFQFRDCSTQATTENQLKHRSLKTSENLPGYEPTSGGEKWKFGHLQKPRENYMETNETCGLRSCRLSSFQVSGFPSFRKPGNQRKPAETRIIIFHFADVRQDDGVTSE